MFSSNSSRACHQLGARSSVSYAFQPTASFDAEQSEILAAQPFQTQLMTGPRSYSCISVGGRANIETLLQYINSQDEPKDPA